MTLLAFVRDRVGDSVTSFEIIPAHAIEMVRVDMPDVRDPNPSPIPWRVLCEVSLAKEAYAQDLLESALSEAMEAGLVSDAVLATSLEQAQSFWKIRESIPLSKRAYGTAINHDVSVPISKIPDFLEAAQSAVNALAPSAEIVAFGHVGDGNLHYSACEPKNTEKPILIDLAQSITEAVHKTTLAFGGSISAEHGVGRLKRDELALTRSPAATETMKAIKKALDPQNIMNPRRVVSV